MQVENLTLRACRELNTRCAGSPLSFVCGKSGTRIVRGPRQFAGKDISIFDSRGGAL